VFKKHFAPWYHNTVLAIILALSPQNVKDKNADIVEFCSGQKD